MEHIFINDSELWSLLKEGDEEAYSQLFRRYYPSLVSYGKTLIRNESLVKDCVQEVFIEVWIYRQKLVDPLSVKAYLLSSVRKRIARRIERDHIFRNADELNEDLGGISFTILEEIIADEESKNQVASINKHLNNLPKRQKEALYLRFHQGLDIDQIAGLMDINLQSASNLLHRGIKLLRLACVTDLSSLIFLIGLIY